MLKIVIIALILKIGFAAGKYYSRLFCCLKIQYVRTKVSFLRNSVDTLGSKCESGLRMFISDI